MHNPVMWLTEIGINALPFVGGKAANLGALVRHGIRVPAGFCIRTDASKSIKAEGDGSSVEGTEATRLSPAVRTEILAAYHTLCASAPNCAVAVRSSATLEDSNTSSFAGQFSSYLNIRGNERLLESVEKCLTSASNPRVQSYLKSQGISIHSVQLGIIVQEMINGEVSGVMFTANPVNGDQTKIVIEAGWGLAEPLVSGALTPDTFILDKETSEICSRFISEKTFMLTMDKTGTKREPLSSRQANAASLTTDQLKMLVQLGKQIEGIFSYPQDIEWTFDRVNQQLHILQSRPITTT